jgi:hypothetical protein
VAKTGAILQDDGRTLTEEREHLARIHQARQRLTRDRRAAAREAVRRQHRAVLRQAYCRRADRGLTEQMVDVGEREQVDEVVGFAAMQVDAGGPDLRKEGLGVAAEQV